MIDTSSFLAYESAGVGAFSGHATYHNSAFNAYCPWWNVSTGYFARLAVEASAEYMASLKHGKAGHPRLF
jgi:hypothetical protein